MNKIRTKDTAPSISQPVIKVRCMLLLSKLREISCMDQDITSRQLQLPMSVVRITDAHHAQAAPLWNSKAKMVITISWDEGDLDPGWKSDPQILLATHVSMFANILRRTWTCPF